MAQKKRPGWCPRRRRCVRTITTALGHYKNPNAVNRAGAAMFSGRWYEMMIGK